MFLHKRILENTLKKKKQKTFRQKQLLSDPDGESISQSQHY